MSKAIHELLNNENVAASHSLAGIQGDFPMDEAVLEGRLVLNVGNLVLNGSDSNARRDESNLCRSIWILCLDNHGTSLCSVARWDTKALFFKGLKT